MLCDGCGKRALVEGEGHELCFACRGWAHDPLDCASCLAMEYRALTQRVKITLRWAHERTAFPPSRQEAVEWCRLRQVDAGLDGSAEVRAQLLRLSKHFAARTKQGYVPAGPFRARTGPKEPSQKTPSNRVASTGTSVPVSQHSTAGDDRTASRLLPTPSETATDPSTSTGVGQSGQTGPGVLDPVAVLAQMQMFMLQVQQLTQGSQGTSGECPTSVETPAEE